MTGKRNETRSTGLSYPMVELLTGVIMQLMYLNTLAVCCLLPLTSPWLFMQAWARGLQNERASAGIPAGTEITEGGAAGAGSAPATQEAAGEIRVLPSGVLLALVSLR